MKKIFISCVALLSLSLYSCKDDSDTQKPTIVIEAPTSEAQFAPGTDIHFAAELSDNDELRSYKVDIHDASGHDHKSKASAAWSLQKEFNIAGKRNYHAHEHFDIPADTKPGKYHFVVYCTDKSGNEQVKYVTIKIGEVVGAE